LLLSWAAGPASAAATSTTRPATTGLLPVMVLAGQSNMIGWETNISDLTPGEQMTQTSVLFYGPNENGSTWGWLKPPTVFNNDVGTNVGFGPEISIGQHLVLSGTYDLVAQVKYAVGGTDLAVDWYPDPHHFYYGTLLTRVFSATNALQAEYPDRQVFLAGFFWMQGESDALTITMASDYETNLTRFIARVRADFHSPWLPFFLGRIRNGHFPYADTVRQAEADVTAKVADVRLVDTDLLPMDGDNIHYTSDGVVTLGNDFAASYIDWLQHATHIFLPMVADNTS
jgi:hypothetical protein